MRKRNSFMLMLAVVLALCLSITLILAGCDKKEQQQEVAYYLSMKSTEWQTYQNEADIPEGVRLVKTDDALNIQQITVKLTQGEEFTINGVSVDHRFGFSSVFSTDDKLVEGENGAIAVAATGVYTLSLNVPEEELTYTFVAEGSKAAQSVMIMSDNITVGVTESKTITATVYYADGTDDNDVLWSSADRNTATVVNGVVTGVKRGATTITARARKDNTKFATIAVTVTFGNVTGVVIEPSQVQLDIGQSMQVQATVAPQGIPAEDKELAWSSDNDEVATVTNGLITAVASGTTTIRATALSGVSATVQVTVVRHVATVNVDPTSMAIGMGKTRKITVSMFPVDATDTGFSYAVSSNDLGEITVVKEEDGSLSVTGVHVGTANITITPDDESAASVVVAVDINSNAIHPYFVENNVKLALGETKQLTVAIDDPEAEIRNVSYSSTGSKVTLTPDQDNKSNLSVYGEAYGATTITAQVNVDGTTYTTTTNVYVQPQYFYVSGIIDSLGFPADGTTGMTNWMTYSSYDAAVGAGVALKETRLDNGAKTFSAQFHLIPEDGFLVIFDGINTAWDNKLTQSGYYNTTTTGFAAEYNTPKYVNTANADQFKVTDAGMYTFTLYMNTSGALYAFMRMDSLDVRGIEVNPAEGYNATLSLNDDGRVNFAALPDAANVNITDASMVKYAVEEGFEDYLQFAADALDMTAKTLSFKVIKAPATGYVAFALIVSFKQSTAADAPWVDGSIQISIMAEGIEEQLPTQIDFEEERYEIDVNNTGKAWTTTVKAAVDSAAFNKGVVYSTDDAGITVNPSTGEVTGRAFGTFTVKATAVADDTLVAETKVLVYSSVFFMSGTMNSFVEFNQGQTTLEGTGSEQYGFIRNEENDSLFELTLTLSRGDKFQVCYLGMDVNWTNALTASYLQLESGDSAYVSTSDSGVNVYLLQRGQYKVTVDLSGAAAVLKVKYAGEGDENVKAQYSVRIWLVRNGNGVWDGTDIASNILTSVEGTITTGADGNYSVKLTYEFDVSKFSGTFDYVAGVSCGWPNIQFAVSHDATDGRTLTDDLSDSGVIWYNGDTSTEGISITGQAYKEKVGSDNANMWNSEGTCAFWYQSGTVYQGAKLEMTFTFNGYGDIVGISFDSFTNTRA